MKLKDILAISGQGGLFKYVSQGRNGIIVESFADKKRTFVKASAKVSTLEDIAVFTDAEDLPLAKVLKSIFEKEGGGVAISHKSSNEELKKYMEQVVPNYDRDRVYVSDIKKMVQWYNTLHEHSLLNFDETEAEGKPVEGAQEHEKQTTDNSAAKKEVKKETTNKKPAGKPKTALKKSTSMKRTGNDKGK